MQYHTTCYLISDVSQKDVFVNLLPGTLFVRSLSRFLKLEEVLIKIDPVKAIFMTANNSVAEYLNPLDNVFVVNVAPFKQYQSRVESGLGDK